MIFRVSKTLYKTQDTERNINLSLWDLLGSTLPKSYGKSPLSYYQGNVYGNLAYFITKYDPKCLFIYYPKFKFVVIYLFSHYYEKLSNESLSVNILLMFDINRVIFFPFGEDFSKRNDYLRQ